MRLYLFIYLFIYYKHLTLRIFNMLEQMEDYCNSPNRSSVDIVCIYLLGRERCPHIVDVLFVCLLFRKRFLPLVDIVCVCSLCKKRCPLRVDIVCVYPLCRRDFHTLNTLLPSPTDMRSHNSPSLGT